MAGYALKFYSPLFSLTFKAIVAAPDRAHI